MLFEDKKTKTNVWPAKLETAVVDLAVFAHRYQPNKFPNIADLVTELNTKYCKSGTGKNYTPTPQQRAEIKCHEDL